MMQPLSPRTSTAGWAALRTALLLGFIAVTTAACMQTDLAPQRRPRFVRGHGLRRIERVHAQRYWQEHGFVEMVPPVRLPTTHDHRDVTRVWMRIPQGATIAVDWLEDQRRYTLRPPSDTRADRVEYQRYRSERGWAEAVVDVRGWTLGKRGPARFCVLRSSGGRPADPLVGWSWPAGDPEAQHAATRALLQLVTESERPVERPALDRDSAELFARRNDCYECHQANKRLDPWADSNTMPQRATDASGGYSLVMLLARKVPLSRARPVDKNVTDPYVRVMCDDRVLDFPARTEQPRCPRSEIMPMAFRDVARGLADGDAYTQRVCAARGYVYAHMLDAGRRAFAEAFRECGLDVPDRPAAPDLASSATDASADALSN